MTIAPINATGFIALIKDNTLSTPAFDRTKYRSAELIESFNIKSSILFIVRANYSLNHIDRFSLAFMIYPNEHLAEKPHADKLDSDNYQ